MTTTAATGDSPILSYQLVWDNNSGTADIVVSDELVLTKTIIGLVTGYDYRFKVRAYNVYGFGDFSDLSIIRASDVPNVMPMVQTVPILNYVRVVWSEPFNGGDPIDQFEI